MTGFPDTRESFVAAFGHLFEHSPWVVERAWAFRPFADPDALHAGFLRAVAQASPEERLQLVRAHPQLADKAAIAQALTAESAGEQASAGLDCLTPDEYAAFHDLNARYLARFGFPFIICVRLHSKAGILDAMRARLAGEPEAELADALAQVALISRLRLVDALAAGA
jgi:2-oxo-4-hydroxy-4-carboxy-5-ureidoimidazoline decarboxylase